jgi:hypothetical protein
VQELAAAPATAPPGWSRLAPELYRRILASERLRDDLLWANPTITQEVFAHAWAVELGIDNGNPVDIDFADYTVEPPSVKDAIWSDPLSAVLAATADAKFW